MIGNIIAELASFIQQGSCPACFSGTALTMVDSCGANPSRVCCRRGSEVSVP
jgi:hypothetical protein